MGNGNLNAKVDAYLWKAKAWQEEMATLRELLLGCGNLEEELKWGKPCYAVQGKNVVLIVGFKNYCSLLFTKGVLLKDLKGLLVKAGENSQSAMQARFTSLAEIRKHAATIKSYVREAIQVEQSGQEVKYKSIEEHAVPAELQRKFTSTPELKSAFEKLTPGRRRAYLMHFSAAKQSSTRESRIEKCAPDILAGKGLNDR